MTASAPALVDVARDVAAGRATPADLHAALLASTLYCERGPSPGFLALGPTGTGAGAVPVFSSVEQLALARGSVAWFSLSGADLLDLLPAGYDVILDIGGASPVRLRPSAVERQTVVEIEAVP
jgi:SseB protein N-terminal domain